MRFRQAVTPTFPILRGIGPSGKLFGVRDAAIKCRGSSMADTESVLLAARVMHEAIRAYAQAIGEDELPAWAEAPQWMREASREAVEDRLAHPDVPPSAQHEAWMARKRAAGWRYGEAKDARAMTHPSLRPYDELPEAERRKDALVQAIVDAVLLREV